MVRRVLILSALAMLLLFSPCNANFVQQRPEKVRRNKIPRPPRPIVQKRYGSYDYFDSDDGYSESCTYANGVEVCSTTFAREDEYIHHENRLGTFLIFLVLSTLMIGVLLTAAHVRNKNEINLSELDD